MANSKIDHGRNSERKPFSLLEAVRQAAHEQGTKPQLEQIPVARLAPFKRNARTHSSQQLRRVGESITRFGFIVPVLINAENQIVAGHARVEAAKLIGLTHVPALRVGHLSPAEQRAFVIADNRLAELAGWDRDALVIELQGLIELDFPVELTGFDMGEIEILHDNEEEDKHQDDAEPASTETTLLKTTGPVVSQSGDVWILGPHRLACGECPDAAYAAVDAVIRRWQKLTGISATLAGSDRIFNAITKERRKRAAERSCGSGQAAVQPRGEAA